MSRLRLFLVGALLAALPALPIEAIGQVNLPTYRNTSTGELIERPYAERYRQAIRDQVREAQLRQSEKLMNFPDGRGAAYAADPCGLGCEGHAGIQVSVVRGTSIAAVLYRLDVDDGALTVQLRFFNDGTAPERLALDPVADPASFFVRVDGKERYILADEDRELEAKDPLEETLEPGEMESWWARFPAPPSGAKTFDLHIPSVTFRDVPLATD